MDLIIIDSGEPGHFVLQGELTFSSIDKKTVNAFAVNILDSVDKIILDLNQVTCFDSAGLALLIEWIKLAQNKNMKLLFDNIPDQLLAIARLSGFEQALMARKSRL